jgi:hypothetical protein
MEYAVFRFDRSGNPEQWIIPTKELLDYKSIANRKLIFPIPLSEHGGVFNLLFTRAKPRLVTVHGFTEENVFLFYEPSITPSDNALDRLVDEWLTLPYAQKVNTNPLMTENLYRL